VPGSEACGQCSQDLSHLDLPSAQDKVERAFMENPVRSLRPPKPVVVSLNATVADAVQTMIQHNMGAVLILDPAGKLVGIFSERDLLMRVLAGDPPKTALPVRDFMTPNPECVSANDSINFAVHKMAASGYRHVPVLDHGKPVGVISVRDIIRFVVSKC